MSDDIIKRPDWADLYRGVVHTPDRDNDLLQVTRETLRLAMSALRKQNAEDYYHNYGAAEFEIRRVLEDEKMTVKTYDTACHDLAETFLQDVPNLWTKDRVRRLALEIQQTVEDFIVDEQRNYEPPDPPGFEGGFADNH